jgi:hypothetical protein
MRFAVSRDNYLVRWMLNNLSVLAEVQCKETHMDSGLLHCTISIGDQQAAP